MRDIARADWERNKKANEELIINNLMQINMAERVLLLCDEKIKEFPDDKIPDTSDYPVVD